MSQIFKNPAVVQDLGYTFDPAGNITLIKDAALKTVFNANQQIDSACDFTYDPIYRLIEATGREHIGQSAFQFNPPDGDYRDYPFVGASVLNDLQQLRNYTEHYGYDPVGNFQTVAHVAGKGASKWTRTYAYNETSLLEAGQKSNRLSQTTLQTGFKPPPEPYRYDAHGNMVQMPHLPLMQWDFKDQLIATSCQVVNEGTRETTYYVYDADGQRARKITEAQNGNKKNDRFYAGGFEIYREIASGSGVTLARETLHVMDDKQRIALVETQTVDEGAAVSSPTPAQRYQLANHLGSASLELDENGGLISYEEYSPYGNTTFQAGRSAAEVSLKRYRYTGKERDEENGFTYHTARYCAPWLARWISADPIGLGDGRNVYAYVGGNPVGRVDPGGTDGREPTLAEARANLAAAQAKLKVIDAQIAEQKAIIALADAQDKALTVFKEVQKKLAVHKAELDVVQQRLTNTLEHLHEMQVDQAARDKWNEEHSFFDKLVTDYDTEKAYWSEKEKHRDWEVKSNFILDMTDSIVKATPSAAGNTWTVFAGALGTGGASAPAKPAADAAPSATTATGTATKTLYRFADSARPETLLPNLSRAGPLTRAAVNVLMKFKAYREWRADAHMRGDTANSPFVSMIEDPAKLAASTDPWARTIATGEPGAPGVARAPDLGEFSVPKTNIVYPKAGNALSIAETERLFYQTGKSLVDYLAKWITNPY